MKVRIEVKFLSHTADDAGIKKIVIETGHTMPEALKEIERVTGFPVGDRLDKGYGILVNGRSYRLMKKESLLEEGDKIAIIPVMGGG